jgi:hypothetical protein
MTTYVVFLLPWGCTCERKALGESAEDDPYLEKDVVKFIGNILQEDVQLWLNETTEEDASGEESENIGLGNLGNGTVGSRGGFQEPANPVTEERDANSTLKIDSTGNDECVGSDGIGKGKNEIGEMGGNASDDEEKVEAELDDSDDENDGEGWLESQSASGNNNETGEIAASCGDSGAMRGIEFSQANTPNTEESTETEAKAAEKEAPDSVEAPVAENISLNDRFSKEIQTGGITLTGDTTSLEMQGTAKKMRPGAGRPWKQVRTRIVTR